MPFCLQCSFFVNFLGYNALNIKSMPTLARACSENEKQTLNGQDISSLKYVSVVTCALATQNSQKNHSIASYPEAVENV